MNEARRKAIDTVRGLIEELKAKLDDEKNVIETLRDEEQEYYDNMPESFQNGDKGSTAQSAIDALENAVSYIDGFDFDAVVGYLEEAKGA